MKNKTEKTPCALQVSMKEYMKKLFYLRMAFSQKALCLKATYILFDVDTSQPKQLPSRS